VTGQGLPPQDAGYANPDNPVPNLSWQTLRIVVRTANAAPDVLGVEVNGQPVADPGQASALRLNATEGVPLSLALYGSDADADRLDWTASGLPRGMVFTPASDGSKANLAWTPDIFAAQDSNTGTPGLWRFTVTGSDGAASFTRTVEIAVVNVNQTPKILPMPLQLVSEGDTLGFNLLGADADGDALRYSLIYDENTPSGVYFDGATGYFEWTPDQTVVDNLNGDSQAFDLSFQMSDGQETAIQTVQVRVFDVNRVPRLVVSNHAIVVGQTLSLPIQRANIDQPQGIAAYDNDGAKQTAALNFSFTGLPEGAYYDTAAERLVWTPGPGQVGDFTVTAIVGDGKNQSRQTLVLRAVAEAEANAPKILISTTPSFPAQPGQLVVATVRADSYSMLQTLSVEMRGAAVAGNGMAADAWQTVALDAAGRMRFTPTAPGLVEIRVTAIDSDGFSTTKTHTVRVNDPADNHAPVIDWVGLLQGAGSNSAPVEINSTLELKANLQELQAMGYALAISEGTGTRWQNLLSQDQSAQSIDGAIDLGQLDPEQWANGVYVLRLSAWDLAGRTSEISARILIAGEQKTIAAEQTTDALFDLGGHDFALSRSLGVGDFGNWQIPALDFRLSHDQTPATNSGGIAPWQQGARVWLQVPASLEQSDAPMQYLSFTLDLEAQALGQQAGAPVVYHPVLTGSQGWTLTAHSGEGGQENLQRLGANLYSQTTGLPWIPESYTLTDSQGNQYQLDAQGRLTSVTFGDGVQWLVSDAGIAVVGSLRNQRLDFLRDDQGHIQRMTAHVAEDTNPNATAQTWIYRYDSQGRLILARDINAAGTGTPYGYGNEGKLLTDVLTANLSAAANWLAAPTANQWQGSLNQDQTANIAFSVRESELVSSVKTPGAQGAVIVAVELVGGDAQMAITGGTEISRQIQGNVTTVLLRVTEAELKLIRLQGSGNAQIKVSLAGDLNRDGAVDGLDSEAFANQGVDLNGDGNIDAYDRQVLYANYGWRANQAPVAFATLPDINTHADLAKTTVLTNVAQDLEGDQLFWRVLGATHGTAKLGADGQTLLFTPEEGYAGPA
ncbi:MAG: hypothetical protein PHH11_17065, partial [Methylomonas sp.]|nr:hypothetical protein [Methylomonas sp.]